MLAFDFSAFDDAVAGIDGVADQLPFAISRSLNAAVRTTENRLADETWPKHVTVRNRGFLKAALKPELSNKRDLRVALVDTLGRASLKKHAVGGVKEARGNFAIPTSRVRRGAKGVVDSQRPANLKRKVVIGGLIFQATGRGKNQRLNLMFKLQRSTTIKPDVPFYADFRRFMREEVEREFPKALIGAMRTARRRG